MVPAAPPLDAYQASTLQTFQGRQDSPVTRPH